jgi:hypothetical protein
MTRAIALALGVIAYLRANPQACDNVDGIARWWLAPGDDDIDTEVLEMALQDLERRGAVQRLPTAHRTCWRFSGDILALDAAERALCRAGSKP